MKPILIATSSALFLTACATTSEPGIEVRTVEVVRTEQAPCPGEKPERPAPFVRPTAAGLEPLAAALAAKLGEYSLPGGYADKADAIMTRCLAEP